MEQKEFRKLMWEEASRVGLALGLVSTTEMFLNQFLGTMEVLPLGVMSILATLLRIVKFFLCIWIMRRGMKQFADLNTEVNRSMIFRFGFAVALLSALMFSASILAYFIYIAPGSLEAQYSEMLNLFGPYLDNNTKVIMQNSIDGGNLPMFYFFSNLIYCTVYGGILSLILSRNIPEKNPFANYKQDEK